MSFRKIGLLLLTSLLCLTANAQEGYFNTLPGSTLKWVIHDGEGDLFGYCHETLVSLKGNRGQLLPEARLPMWTMRRRPSSRGIICLSAI